MTGSEIIEAVLTHLNKNPSEFARDLGLKRAQNIYDIKKGKAGVSKTMADLITEKFPQLNKNFLLTGEGEMLRKEKPPTIEHASTQNADKAVDPKALDAIIIIARANEKLADSNQRLTLMLEEERSLVHTQPGILEVLAAKLNNVQELLTDVVLKKNLNYTSIEEVDAFLSRVDYANE